MLLPIASKIQVLPFLCAAALAMATAAPAFGRVGVTSQTDGDPLGKPPATAERVLRVGIDIQADELITTKADDRAHIVFLDGTALTVAPNAQLMIDKFVYDPQTRTGEVAVSVVTGVFRLVGGKISKTGTITIKTPSATIGLRGGIGLFVVTAAETKAHFLFGISMAVAAKGRTETATRPGSLIVAKLGGTPGAPAVVSAGAVAAILALLETSKSATGDKNADEEAKKSGFSAQNSERGVDGTSGRGDGRSGDAQQAVSNATLQRDVGTTGSGSGGSSVTGVTGSTTPFFIGPGGQPEGPGSTPGGPTPGPSPGPSPSPSPGPFASHPQAIPDGGRPGNFSPATPATGVPGGWRK